MTRISVGLAAALVLLSAKAADAQEVSAVEGPGYPLGEGTVFHPTVGADLGFTDNVYYQDDATRASGLLRLLVAFAVASKEIEPEPVDPLMIDGEDDAPAEPAAPKLRFRAGGGLRYDEFLSAHETVRSQRTLGADLRGRLEVLPESLVAFHVDEQFVRDTRPTNFESTDQNNRISNTLELGLKVQPGGRTMNGQLRWRNQIDYFEDPDTRFANRMINEIHLGYEWKLFPYTKLLADVSYGFIGGLGSPDLGGMPYKRAANPIRGGVGVASAITELFTVKANVGWAYASYAGGASYNAPILGAEIGFQYSPLGRLLVEYAWEHRDSINADFYRDHLFGARVDHQLWRIVATARGQVRLRGYRGISPVIGPPTRDDVIIAVGAAGTYTIRDTFGVVADWTTEIDQTDYMSSFSGTGDDPSYTRTEITVGVRAAF